MCNKKMCHDFKMANGGYPNMCLFETTHSGSEDYSIKMISSGYDSHSRNY